MVALKTSVVDPEVAIKRLEMFRIDATWAKQELLVPRDKEQNAVRILASAGLLPAAAEWHYDFLRHTDVAATNAKLQESVRATIEELLAETIEALSFISFAEVRLESPKYLRPGSSFSIERAEASVVVGLHNQESLDDEQVAGIVQLVSCAYPAMRSENVVITDTNGHSYRCVAEE